MHLVVCRQIDLALVASLLLVCSFHFHFVGDTNLPAFAPGLILPPATMAGRPIDPLFTLHAGPGQEVVNTLPFSSGKKGGSSPNEPKVGLSSSVSAVCFIRDPNNGTSNEHDQSHASSDSDDDEEPMKFRCSEILLGKEAEIARRSGENGAYRIDRFAASTSAAASAGLRGGLLASSHINGAALIWDLGTRRVVSQFADGSRGPGVALGLQRMGDDNINRGSYHFFYHSRGADGIVSVHDVQPDGSLDAVVNYRTGCQTFCAASACSGSSGAAGLNLLALPTKEECTAAVVDIRVNPTSQPAVLIHGAALAGDASGASSNEWRKHGMLTSLALCATSNTSGPILGCGMESGSVYFHDLAMPGRPIETDFVGAIEQHKRPTFEQDISNDSISYSNLPNCSVSLGKEPVLALDLTASSANGSGDNVSAKGAVIAVAGCAGDADELAGKPKDEQNTISVIKATFDRSLGGDRSTMLQARIRSRIRTCEIGEVSARGKPGVGVCRFRPDGRIFAVGGWDKRLRLFSRSAGATPLALMRTHVDSVTAIDWDPDSATTGILATGSEDGQIALWRAFPHTKRDK